MGQVHVASVQAARLLEVIAEFHRAGFDVARVESDDHGRRLYRCRRSHREVVLEVAPGRQNSDEALVVLAYPPYGVWPWRWIGDYRFFDEITGVLDRFHYLD